MTTASTSPERLFADELVEAGLLLPCGAPGVYGYARSFEDVLAGFDRLVTDTARNDGAESMQFPPITTRQVLETSEFLDSFPQLLGTVFSFDGTSAEHQAALEALRAGGDWSGSQRLTDVVLTPAACYPVYPRLTGTLPAAGRLLDLSAWVYRHEPSDDPARLQSFRVREMVRAGEPEQVVEWRNAWRDRAVQLLLSLGLDAQAVPASDPFFGRGGRLLAANQREQGFKFEIVVPIAFHERPTAVASFNYHQDHFGRCFAIRARDGATAHTACLGFGLERVTLALFKCHGLQTVLWPATVREQLGL